MDPDPTVRREGMEKLWDAFERLKTLEGGKNKKAQAEVLLAKAIPNPDLRERVNEEMLELTEIGNSFHIRHSETTQTDVRRAEDVDYLFQRLYAVVVHLLRCTGRM